MVPVRVSSPRSVGVAAASARRSATAGSCTPAARTKAPIVRASPKSTTCTRPPTDTITFDSLKSRCTTPARCAADRPRPASSSARSTSARVRRCSVSQARSDTPSMSSMAMKSAPANLPTSNAATTFGCDSRASAWASRSRRCSYSSVVPEPSSSTGLCSTSFSATSRDSSGSWARNTTPMPPLASFSTIR